MRIVLSLFSEVLFCPHTISLLFLLHPAGSWMTDALYIIEFFGLDYCRSQLTSREHYLGWLDCVIKVGRFEAENFLHLTITLKFLEYV